MAAMKGGFTFDILNYNSVSDSNNNGIATRPAGPPTPLLHEKNNFMRYPLNNCEIINLDDDLVEIQNHNTFPPFLAPAQSRNSEYLMPAQHGYSSSSSRLIRPNIGYSNSANNGMIYGTTLNFSNMLNNNNNNNPHQIISPSPQQNGSGLNFSNPVTETQPPTGTMTHQIEISEQQQQQQKEQEQVLVQTEEEVGTNQVSLENQGIDLNKTPQPKQRRRKYVPKVFKEKKPRAPKSVTPKPGTEVRQKRKYVRKKGIEIPGNDKPIEGPGSCTPNGGEKSVEVPSSCTPNIEVPSSCTPNGVDKPIEVPSSCTPNGGDKSIEVPNSCTQNGTSGVRKPVRRSLNFDQEELNPNAYNNNSVNNTNNTSNNISQPNLGTVPVPLPSTGTGTKINVSTVPVSVPNSSVRAKGFSLDLNQSTNQIQEEFDRTFPPVGQKIGTNQNGTNRVQNGSGINFSGYPYPPMPNVRPNNHMINNNSMVNMPKFRPNGLMALAMKNEHLLKTLGNYTRVNNHLISTSGVKRDHSNILLQNGNNNSARAGDGQKKMRITDQNNNNNNNILHQNGTVRPNSSNPNSSSVALHNVGPTGGVFSLADIQRITEIRKRQNPQAQQMLNGTPVTISPTTTAVASCQVATPDRPAFWFNRSEPGPSNAVPITNNNINNSRPNQVNQVYNKPPPVANSIQTYSEKTTTINQHSNNPSIITTEISPAQQKPEPKRRGRQKKDKQILSDPFSTTPPAKEKPGPKPRGRKPASLISSLATSALSFEATIESIIQKMKLLDINRASQNFPVQSSPYQSFAMVPYNNGMSGTMVQYENVEKKKRKFRVRVDLDPVTNHVWNLLMGKEMNEEPLDENKEKVLEEEREIFKGRIDSFIARMHLVQGDRRFSPWKGSVVDSVVGVFLTQNVSDHLSSSAFMGLVSKYPPQTRPINPERETNLSIRSIISLQNFHKNVVTIEDFSSEEKDENNSSQDSSTKCTLPHLQETNDNNNINVKPAAESSPDSGPGSIEDQNSVVSSQNSVVSSQNSEDLNGSNRFNGSNGSGWLYDLDPFNAPHTSYTQLLQFAESNRCDLFPDLNKVTNAMGASCSYSNNNVGFYSQNGNSDCSAFPSGTMNNLSLGYSHPHNGNNYSDSVMPGLFKGNNTTGISEASHNLNLDMGISTPSSPVANQTCAQPITPMIKINQNPPNRNEYISNTKPPASETAHNVSNASSTIASETVHNASSKTVSRTVHNFSNNPSKTSSETVQAASVDVHNFLNNSSRTVPATMQNLNAASVTVQNAPINNNNKAASETVQNAPNNNNKVASPTTQNASKAASETVQKTMDGGTIISEGISSNNNNKPKRASSKAAKSTFDWDSLRRGVRPPGTPKQERSYKAADSLDYEALRRASVRELSDAIRERGMNNMLAERIKDFLERLVRDHGSVDLEWLRDVDPGKAKDYLLSVRGLGLKSVECVRLLTLHHLAFPVDTNVGRICVRLGWVPLQPLPESLQLHLLEMYPILENIQKYLWPRLCKLDQRTLYELHYQMITFGKVFCTKSKPNCNACPMRAECKHFASAFASARLALPGPEEKGLIASTSTPTNANPNTPSSSTSNWTPPFHPQLPLPSISTPKWTPPVHPQLPSVSTQPIIEEPASPEPEPEQPFEDAFLEEEEDPDEIPTIKLDFEEFKKNLKSYIKRNNLEVGEADMSKALVAISPEKASLPTPKLKNISRLRTEHQVYELPDNHELLAGYERREPDDPCPYLLSIWTPGETAVSTDPPKSLCISQDVNELCDKEACLRCVGIKEARRQVVRGTVLIPCRTAMRGSFPLNGTYFQVNELFADHESSRNPVECPRGWIWNLPRRTVYFGTSIPTIFKGLSTEEIQHCFWRGFVCVRGFDRATRAPRPLYARLHFPASKLNKNGKKAAKEED